MNAYVCICVYVYTHRDTYIHTCSFIQHIFKQYGLCPALVLGWLLSSDQNGQKSLPSCCLDWVAEEDGGKGMTVVNRYMRCQRMVSAVRT